MDTFDTYTDFLLEVLRAIHDSNGDSQKVYPLLQANLEKLDANLAQSLRGWVKRYFSKGAANQTEPVAELIVRFSDLIEQLSTGNRGNNLEIAIIGYQSALQVYTHGTFLNQSEGSSDYVRAIASRGETYRLVKRYDEALADFDRAIELDPNYAFAFASRGETYRLLGQYDKALADFDRAIDLDSYYTFALASRGWVYMALNCYNEALADFDRAIELDPNYVFALSNRGEIYRLLGHYNEALADFDKAIAVYESALEGYTLEGFAEQWAAIQIKLGNTYQKRIQGERSENIDFAIQCYEKALQVYSQEAFPEKWAETHKHLASAYVGRINGEKAENLEQTITYCEKALQVFTREAFLHQWSSIQVFLAVVYRDRIHGNQAENIEKAIACCQNALLVFTREAFPEEWAINQVLLASVYCDSIGFEQAENIEKAIACCQNALQVLTREAFPQDWATTQQTLAEAYLNRTIGVPENNRKQSIAYCQNALQIYTFETSPQKWAITQNLLGGAYIDLTRGERAENIEKSITSHQNALKVYTSEAFPQDWAGTQNLLGIAYRERIWGERCENLEKAITCYENALQVYTFESLPTAWAITQTNLGNVYGERICGERSENLEKAITCHENALRVFTCVAFPENYLEASFNLGIVYLIAKQFGKAYNVLESAIETTADLLSLEQWMYDILPKTKELTSKYPDNIQVWRAGEFIYKKILYGKRTQAKRVSAERWARLYSSMVEVCLELAPAEPQYYAKAIEYVERNKTRNLAQLLNCTLNTPQKVAPISFKEIQDLLDERTAIVEWHIAPERFQTFIVTHHRSIPVVWQSGSEESQALISWITEYFDYIGDKSHLQKQLTDRLKKLSEILHLDQILDLIPETCDQVILIPHWFLHRLPLHALPLPDGSCVIDCFPRGVRYAPSCQLLQLAQNQHRPDFSYFFAVQDPSQDLAYSNLEVETIRHYFQPANHVLVKDAATKEALNKFPYVDHLRSAHCIHFACHGSFDFVFPLQSHLKLADKPLFLREIFNLDLNQCRLVTLSACETGLSDITISDEYISLPSGFLYAGAASVVSTLWTVDDIASALLMIRFYENLQTDLTVAVALNIAQTWLRDATTAELQAWADHLKLASELSQQIEEALDWFDSDEKPFQAPYYWAAFCTIGQ
ncbi:CHAT domain-containing protein [Microcoleus sp. FACHB-53]|nr:CHAT domain-containing protein [Microcoleus sp. FACHB-53]